MKIKLSHQSYAQLQLYKKMKDELTLYYFDIKYIAF